MKKLLALLLKSKAGRLLLVIVLKEFITWLKILAADKYGNATGSNPKLDYTNLFLDGIQPHEIVGFTELPDLKAPVITVTTKKKTK